MAIDSDSMAFGVLPAQGFIQSHVDEVDPGS